MEQQDLHLPAFFAVLRSSLWGTSPACDVGFDSAAVWQELKHHAIQNLAVDTMASLDPAHQMQYIQSAAQSYHHWYSLMQVQQQIMDLLLQAQIPCAVLKGSAANVYYPNPLNRNMGDIDILVKPQDFAQAVQILLSGGCALHDDRNPKHTEFRKNGIAIELHRHFATLNHQQRASTLDAMLFDALDRVEKAELEGFHFYMLPPLENGIVLMEHINSHMESGLGLRQIIDWMLYANRHLSDPVWFQQFSGMIRQVGLEKLACTVTRMCQLYLGLSPDITWCQLSDIALCHRLMTHTLQQGNFGRKQVHNTQKAVILLGALDTERNFFRLLQKHGCHNWRALKRHPWLKPFAWLYQLCRYIRKALSGKKPLRAFFRAFGKKKKNSDLLDALGVLRKDHSLQYDT